MILFLSVVMYATVFAGCASAPNNLRIKSDVLRTGENSAAASAAEVSGSQPSKTLAQDYRQTICDNQRSCHLLHSVSDMERTLLVRNCMCDADCNLYGDCCIDSEFYNAADQKPNYERFHCPEEKYYMKASCASSYTSREAISKCAQGVERAANAPLVIITPITDVRRGMTYANAYCALCDHRHPTNDRLLPWNVTFSCDATPSARHRNGTPGGALAAAANVTWDGVLRQYRGHDGHIAYSCRPMRLPPDHLSSQLRRCVPAVSSCPADADRRLAAKCESFSLFVHDLAVSYRNAFCAECNRVNETLNGCMPGTTDRVSSSQLLFSASNKAVGSSTCSDPNLNPDVKMKFCP